MPTRVIPGTLSLVAERLIPGTIYLLGTGSRSVPGTLYLEYQVPVLISPLYALLAAADIAEYPYIYEVAQGSETPALQATLMTSAFTVNFGGIINPILTNPQPVNLTGAAVKFIMWSAITNLILVNAAAAVVSAVAGLVSYQWLPRDTLGCGYYYARFVVTWSTGAVSIFPDGQPLSVRVS